MSARRPTPARRSTRIGSAVLGRVLPGFNLLVGSEKTPQVVLDALHGITDVKILSNPSLVVMDNGVATLQVGDQVPITTGTATVLSANNAVVNTINYQNTGIILRVVPRVSFNNTVRLDIEQEISNVSDTSATGTLTPTISERKVKSTLTVADGQTVLLAGLISETQNKTRNGIPLLDQLPGYLGDAFSHQNKTTAAHRTHHLHPAADHPRRRRCPSGGGRTARKAEEPHRHGFSEISLGHRAHQRAMMRFQ